jgi:hypothetical protein
MLNPPATAARIVAQKNTPCQNSSDNPHHITALLPWLAGSVLFILGAVGAFVVVFSRLWRHRLHR